MHMVQIVSFPTAQTHAGDARHRGPAGSETASVCPRVPDAFLGGERLRRPDPRFGGGASLSRDAQAVLAGVEKVN